MVVKGASAVSDPDGIKYYYITRNGQSDTDVSENPTESHRCALR